MIYGKELGLVIRAKPGHEFRMAELMKGVTEHLVQQGVTVDRRKQRAIRVGIADLLKVLEANGTLRVKRAKKRGSYSLYRLK